MHGDIAKGSDQEIKHTSETTKIPAEIRTDNVKHPKYMIFDFETDTRNNILEDGSVLHHQVLHVEAGIIQISDHHMHEDSLIYTISFTGYHCCNDFCKWLFDKQNQDCTIIARNGSPRDNPLILQWCVNHGLNPEMITRQGSIVTYMHF